MDCASLLALLFLSCSDPIRVLAIGESTTAAANGPFREGKLSYAEIIQDSEAVDMQIFAVSYSTISSWLPGGLPWYGMRPVAAISDIAIIWTGIGDATVGTDPDLFSQHLLTLAEALYGEGVAEVWLLRPYISTNLGMEAIDPYDVVIRELCDTDLFMCPVDTWHVLNDGDYGGFDPVHPLTAGARRVAAAVLGGMAAPMLEGELP